MSDRTRNGDGLFPDPQAGKRAAANAFREFVRETYRTLRTAGLVTRSPDTIAYTPDFEALFHCILVRHPDAKRQKTCACLINVRKRGEAKAKS